MINIKDDSRKVVKGDIFVALRGIISDGHDYIEKAISNGASLIVAEEGSYSVETLIVKDTKEYLINYLKDNYYDQIKDMTFIGITGTNGKTTCAYLLHSILNKLGNKTGYIGTIGYYIDTKQRSLSNTTPDICLTYELLLDAKEKGCKTIVMEVSSEGIAHKRLDGILFDYAAFTNLTQDHLDYHKTMENYALAKQLLFKRLRNDKKAIINIDDAYRSYFLLEENNNITYGFSNSDYQLLEYKPNQVTTFKYQHNGVVYESSTRLIGDYNLYNLMLVVSILNEMGYEDVNEIIKDAPAPPGRMQYVLYDKGSILIDFAHTPDAIDKILEIVKPVVKGKLYAIIGCGGDRDRTKRPIMGKSITDGCDHVIFTNEDPRTEDEDQIIDDMIKGASLNNYEIIKDRVLAIHKGIDLLTDDDMLLVLGKGHEEFIIMKDYKIPFNDYKTVIEYIKECK
jgi:UDP-N-acetylmuramoyl-L-alanyl-D-glutamate--2,6-diaminopimelate ligase